jgi:hypothetical protein
MWVRAQDPCLLPLELRLEQVASTYLSTLGLKNTVKNHARNRPQAIHVYIYMYIRIPLYTILIMW